MTPATPKSDATDLDPVRQTILDRVRERRQTLLELSRLLGRNAAYMHQFIYKGSPRHLDERARHQLAAFLELDERELRDWEFPSEPAPIVERRARRVVEPTSGTVVDGRSKPAAMPFYAETGVLEPDRAVGWTDRDLKLPDDAFVVLILQKRPAFKPGDRVFVSPGCEPREGDLAMVVSNNAVTDIGVVTGRSDDELQIEGSDATSKRFSLATHQAAKILAVIFA